MSILRSTILLVASLTCVGGFAQAYDARIDSYVGLKYPCDGVVTPVLRIQNMGTTTMSTCVVETWKNGALNNTFNWILAVPAVTGAYRQPAMPTIPVSPGDELEFRIITVNTQPDEVATGNVLVNDVDGTSDFSNNYQVQVEVLTDNNPTETTWKIVDDLGVAVAQGGPYSTANAVQQQVVTLPASDCLALRVADSGGNGMNAGTAGRVKVIGGGADVITVNGGDFTSASEKGLRTGGDPCLPTQLTTTADPVISCGATGLLMNGTNTISATAVPGANKYQFRFRRGSYNRSIAWPTRSFQLYKWATKPLLPGKTYNVDVRVSFDNGATWCPYGPICTIATAVAIDPIDDQRMLDEITGEEITVELFPNPSDGSHFNLHLTGVVDDAVVQMEIVDAMGRLVEAHVFTAMEDGVLGVDLRSPLTNGLYIVRFTFEDGEVQTRRLSVQ